MNELPRKDDNTDDIRGGQTIHDSNEKDLLDQGETVTNVMADNGFNNASKYTAKGERRKRILSESQLDNLRKAREAKSLKALQKKAERLKNAQGTALGKLREHEHEGGQMNDGQMNDGQMNDGQMNDGQMNDGQTNNGQQPKQAHKQRKERGDLQYYIDSSDDEQEIILTKKQLKKLKGYKQKFKQEFKQEFNRENLSRNLTEQHMIDRQIDNTIQQKVYDTRLQLTMKELGLI